MDRFSKIVRYLACRKDIDAPAMARLLYKEVFSKVGILRSIILDRGTLFTLIWWSTFCYHLTVKRRLSTAFHPQTDGQTERQNQTLKNYLRAYINYQ
jgi:transposase InsO family protein